MVTSFGNGALGNVNLAETFRAEKHPIEFFKKDVEVMEKLEEMKTPEMTDGIVEHLVKEGKPGSAEYIQVFSKSIVLDKELALAESGKLNNQLLESEGLPVMIDTAQTTPDMLQEGRAVLTPDARQEFLGALNSLSYKLQQHITKTADTASRYYAEELSHKAPFAEKLQAMLGKRSEPYEIPLIPDEKELAQLQEINSRLFMSQEEQQKAFKVAIEQMMRNRPAAMGLGTTSDLLKHFNALTAELGGKMDGSVNVEELRRLNTFMTNQGMAELQIYPGFGQAIQEKTTVDFSQITSKIETIPDTTPSVESTEKTSMAWITEDITPETKDRLIKGGHDQIADKYTEEEAGLVKLLAQGLTETTQAEGNKGLEYLKALSEIENKQDDQETMKLMLRIVIKVGTKVAVSLARNLAKDKDTPEELRAILGTFADMVDSGGKFADKLVAGNPKANLENDLIKYFSAEK